MKILNVACISGWQAHAVDFSRKLLNYADCRVTVIYDEDIERGKKWAAEIGARFEPDYDKVITSADVDAVCITSATRLRSQYIIKAANAGKHIFVEKPAFSSNEEAFEAARVVKNNNIKFLVSDPVIKVIRQMVWAKEKIEEGIVGTVTVVRVRSAHTEALTDKQPEGVYRIDETGGGAYIDMGCHSCHMLEFFLGKPTKASAVFSAIAEKTKSYPGVEDNAVCVYEFDNGAIGVAETGWVSDTREDGFLISGTKGSIQCFDRELRYRTNESGWIVVPESEWPEGPVYPLRRWADAVLYDTPLGGEDIDEAVLFTQMISAAYGSKGLGKEV